MNDVKSQLAFHSSDLNIRKRRCISYVIQLHLLVSVSLAVLDS
jgi:hypothetical protein